MSFFFPSNRRFWERVKEKQSKHHLQSFSRTFDDLGGSENTLFANNGTHGPSYKMIVDFGLQKRFVTIAGGVSGDPLSSTYDQYLKNWRQKAYKEVNLFEPSYMDRSKFWKVNLRGGENVD